MKEGTKNASFFSVDEALSVMFSFQDFLFEHMSEDDQEVFYHTMEAIRGCLEEKIYAEKSGFIAGSALLALSYCILKNSFDLFLQNGTSYE